MKTTDKIEKLEKLEKLRLSIEKKVNSFEEKTRHKVDNISLIHEDFKMTKVGISIVLSTHIPIDTKPKLYRKFNDPTEYSKEKVAYYEKRITYGEALSDLRTVKKVGVHYDYPNDFILWNVFEWWMEEEPDSKKSVEEIKDLCVQFNNGLERPVNINITTIYHHINKFMILGAQKRKKVHDLIKGDKIYIYYFEPLVKKRGLEWLRIGNKYFGGNFQKEQGFNLLKK